MAISDIREIYTNLLAFPFIDATAGGLVFQDVVRETISNELQRRDPERFKQLRRRAYSYFTKQSHRAVATTLWQYTADLLYMIENPIARGAFFPKGASDLRVEPAIVLGSKQNSNPDVPARAFEKFSSAGIRVHLFGNMKFSSITDFPIWACDTTAWAQRGLWGFIYYWNPHSPDLDQTDKIYLEEFMDITKKYRFMYSNYEYRSDLDEYLYNDLKITISDLYGPDGVF